MTVYFTNPGLVDPRAIVTMGVNVKDTSAPIGMFGTGLKYAIAVCLRKEQMFRIFVGTDVYAFMVEFEKVRGKEFGFIAMQKNNEQPHRLGFTTHLGMNWTLQHAYRELYSNMKDEGGDFSTGHPDTLSTTIAVKGEAFDAVHKDRASFLLLDDRVFLEGTDDVDIFAGGSKYVYYRGIAAMELSRPSLYTYNIKCDMTLTEDRTFAYGWDVNHYIMKAISKSNNRAILNDTLTAEETRYERQLDYDWSNNRPSEMFTTVLREKIHTDLSKVVPTAQTIFFKGIAGDGKIDYKVQRLNADEEGRLLNAIAFCNKIGFPVLRDDVIVAETLGNGIDGRASEGKIYISYSCFKDYILRETLIEEFVHNRHQVRDYTREMQNVLFSHIVRLGEELETQKKEPV